MSSAVARKVWADNMKKARSTRTDRSGITISKLRYRIDAYKRWVP